METFWSLQTASMVGTIFAFLLAFVYRLLHIPNVPKNNKAHNKTAPQLSGAWPFIGHLHLLNRARLPHMFLVDMADKHGPIFSMKLGVHQAFVVSDWNMAKECFTTNDKAIVDRPKFLAVELIGYNFAMFGLGPYGNYWRHMHRMVMNKFLFNKQVELHAPLLVSEVRGSINDIYKLCVNRNEDSGSNPKMVKVEMKEWFGSLTLNMVVRMIAGKRYNGDDEEGSQFLQAMRKFFDLAGAVNLSDAIPYLRWLDIGGNVKEMKKNRKEIDNILTKWLEEHKRKKANVSNMQVPEGNEQEDFMDVMLLNLQHSSEEDLGGFDADTVNKATCLTLLIGATDTVTVTLTWALSLLLNNPHALAKAREELDKHIGRGRQVNESDTKNLVYLQAIVKETLRLYPAGPLAITRVATMDCVVGGYDITKGSQVIINLTKIHRDPNVWLDPNKFRPERFFTTNKDVDFRGQHFELLPFGSGRRICPGISLGVQILLLTLGTLIHEFELSSPGKEGIDMSESENFGLTNLKATPLEVFLTPRLSSNE